MDPNDTYKFCPRCGNKLEPSKESLQCISCGFHFYLNPAPTNAIILENDKKEILLVKRKFEPKKGFWDTAGGFILPDESVEQSVKREIKEELNVDVKMTGIIGIYPDKYLFQEIIYPTLNILVTVDIISGTLQAMDDAAEIGFFPYAAILEQQFAFPWIKIGLQDYLNQKSLLSE